MTASEFRRLRLAAGLSLNGAARVLGVARSTICRWENGGRRIPSAAADTLRELAARQDDGGA